MNRFLNFIKWLLVLLLFWSLSIFTKIFVVDSYHVPTPSMKGAIWPGENILVSKITYGPLWPENPLEIPWFNLLALIDYFRPWYVETRWSFNRWPIGEPISRDDVVVFKAPIDDQMVVVKRCKGLPGEEIELRTDQLYLYDSLINEPLSVHYGYTSTYSLDTQSLYAERNYKGVKKVNLKQNNYKLHPIEARRIRTKFGSQSVRINEYYERINNEFGPVRIPAQGDTINLNDYRADLKQYKKIINQFEGANCQLVQDTIYINGKVDSLFVFNNNYYFMMGDNRHESADSRRWGFVPEQNIIGKALWVWYSKDPFNESIRWERLFHRIE